MLPPPGRSGAIQNATEGDSCLSHPREVWGCLRSRCLSVWRVSLLENVPRNTDDVRGSRFHGAGDCDVSGDHQPGYSRSN